MADRHYNSDWEDEFGRLEEAMPEEKEHVAMRDITTDDRPREKLLKMGAEKLSRAELLAILIGSGSTRQNATELMTDIISDCGPHEHRGADVVQRNRPGQSGYH